MLLEVAKNKQQECGFERVVLGSSLGAGDYNKSFPNWHRKAEDRMPTSGMKYCIPRPNASSKHRRMLRIGHRRVECTLRANARRIVRRSR